MKNKSGKGNGQTKGKPAIRSAGNQTTGNCNKQMLVAERGRTDKVNGRLNRQNPVGSQNSELTESERHLSKMQALKSIGLKDIQFVTDQLYLLRERMVEDGDVYITYPINEAIALLNKVWLIRASLK